MQKEENRKWILENMKKIGSKSTTNTQYQFWIQDDGAEEIFTSKFFQQKLDYIHYNPVRAEIVLDPIHYAWSSARLTENDDYRFINPIDECSN